MVAGHTVNEDETGCQRMVSIVILHRSRVQETSVETKICQASRLLATRLSAK